MFAIFGQAMLIALFLAVPLWVFFVPLFILISIYIKFRRRTTVRTVCAVIALLISLLAIPFVAVQGYYRMEADERLESEFGVPVSPFIVTRYRFEPGFLDSVEYWKLRNLDPNTCRQIISKNGMTEAYPGHTYSGPSWWPKSSSGYSVFERTDRDGGSKEIWIPNEGSSVYLFCFLE